jgi:hypothetical protein
MARKEALIIIPEDREKIFAGETINVQILIPVTHIFRSGLTIPLVLC